MNPYIERNVIIVEVNLAEMNLELYKKSLALEKDIIIS